MPNEGDHNAPVRKGRTSIACDRCAKAKIRCDGRIPCNQCCRKDLTCTVDRPHPVIKRRATLGIVASPPLSSCHPADLTTGPSVGNREEDAEAQANSAGCTSVESHNIPPRHEATPETETPLHEEVDVQWVEMSHRDPAFSWDDLNLPPTGTTLFESDFLPSFLWLSEDTDLPSMVPGTQSFHRSMEDTSQDAMATKNTINPYANYPYVHQPKQGPIVRVSLICDFLHDTTSWKRICELKQERHVRTTFNPVIAHGIRDTISARMHAMLSKALENDTLREIPHLFPPLETLQSLFHVYWTTFGTIYPIVHPSTFSEAIWASNQAYADIGLFLSTLMVLGSLMVPTQEARLFAVEMAFLIRNMINETMTRDENQLNDKWTVSAAILITVFSSWSGNKRHAELAEAFRGAFTTVGDKPAV